jgi:predicted negative regulator of RcsB-dependent stress response
MSTPPPNQPSVNPNRPGDPAAKTDVEPPFEEQLRALWDKKENRTTVFVGCLVVALVILGWYGYKALAAQREAEVESAYSTAVTPVQMRVFAQDNQGHPLAGAAHLKLADEAYAAGNYAAAIADYEKVVETLPGTPFASRALLGKAMCEVRSEKITEGMAALRQLADDVAQRKAVRCEAAFHLATLEFDAGSFDDVTKLTDLIMQLDTGGVWAQRATQMRLHLPAAAAPGPVAPAQGQVTPAVSSQLPGS